MTQKCPSNFFVDGVVSHTLKEGDKFTINLPPPFHNVRWRIVKIHEHKERIEIAYDGLSHAD
jgi:hypothetical protein